MWVYNEKTLRRAATSPLPRCSGSVPRFFLFVLWIWSKEQVGDPWPLQLLSDAQWLPELFFFVAVVFRTVSVLPRLTITIPSPFIIPSRNPKSPIRVPSFIGNSRGALPKGGSQVSISEVYVLLFWMLLVIVRYIEECGLSFCYLVPLKLWQIKDMNGRGIAFSLVFYRIDWHCFEHIFFHSFFGKMRNRSSKA